ncbi:alpha/beta hydrolase [Bacteroidales bacterium]
MKTTFYHQKKIAYTVSGDGSNLIFLHGFPMDHRVWDGFIPVLESHFRVIAIDLPGFGQSEMQGHIHSMDMMAGAVNAVMEQEQIAKAVIVGHSMGGYVAMAFAGLFPSKLEGIVLFHSHAAADDEAALASRNAAIAQASSDHLTFVSQFAAGLFDSKFLKQQPEAVQTIDDIVRSQKKEAVVAALAGMRDRSSKLDVLHQMAVPILFILGKTDSRMPFAHLMAQLALPAQAELLLLSGVGHMGYLESANTTRSAIRHFAQRCFDNS